MEAFSILGWKNEHELNSFPFTSPLVSDQKLEIAFGIFADAQVVTRGIPTVKVKSIAITSSAVLVELVVVSPSLSYSLTSETSINELDGGGDIVDADGVSCGKFIFGRNAQLLIKKTINRIYTFKSNEILLEPSCILALGTNHVTGVKHVGEEYRGAIVLKEGNGVTISKEEVEDSTIITISATGSSLGECCADDYTPLKTINGIDADSMGNILIGNPEIPEPDNKNSLRETIKITETSNGIKLEIA